MTGCESRFRGDVATPPLRPTWRNTSKLRRPQPLALINPHQALLCCRFKCHAPHSCGLCLQAHSPLPAAADPQPCPPCPGQGHLPRSWDGDLTVRGHGVTETPVPCLVCSSSSQRAQHLHPPDPGARRGSTSPECIGHQRPRKGQTSGRGQGPSRSLLPARTQHLDHGKLAAE